MRKTLAVILATDWTLFLAVVALLIILAFGRQLAPRAAQRRGKPVVARAADHLIPAFYRWNRRE
jgi:hypothetical protein